MGLKIWHCLNVFWLLIFLATELFILLRRFDGAGAVQTPITRIIASIFLFCFFTIVAIIQLIIWLLIRKNKKTR
ncbi:DUF3923 family protein [Liquorilactobacillus aquaticus]|uniref:DUF3923 family protein n=1 Tax=Liquorilactobacillus aquaticus TaxID=392566 RepID=UPI000710DEA3